MEAEGRSGGSAARSSGTVDAHAGRRSNDVNIGAPRSAGGCKTPPVDQSVGATRSPPAFSRAHQAQWLRRKSLLLPLPSLKRREHRRTPNTHTPSRPRPLPHPSRPTTRSYPDAPPRPQPLHATPSRTRTRRDRHTRPTSRGVELLGLPAGIGHLTQLNSHGSAGGLRYQLHVVTP